MVIVMAEKKEASYRANKVVIQGTMEGYNVAPLEDLRKLAERTESMRGEITMLKGQLSDLQKALNAMNLRLERLENFLKGFRNF